MTSYALKFDGVKNITVVNNTLVNIGGNSFLFELLSAKGGIIKNNLVYQSGTPRLKVDFSNIDVGHNGWFQVSAGGMGRASDTTVANPLFADEAANDYRLSALSSTMNAGVDVGAFEYNPGRDTTAPAAPTGVTI